MKKITIVLVILISLLAACTRPDETPKEIITKVVDSYYKHSSMSYKVSYRFKGAGDEDTMAITATCQLVRDTTDTLVGGRVWFLVNDTFETYYNGKRFYYADRSTKKLIDCEGTEDNVRFIYGTSRGSTIMVRFLDTKRLLKYLNDSTNKVSLQSDKDHYIITIRYPDDEECSERASTFYVKKDECVIDKLRYKVKFQGDYQYEEWNLSDIRFDNVATPELEKAMLAYKKSYTPEPYPPVEEPILEAGVTAPAFTGVDFNTGKEVSLNMYKGKTVILDFAYMSCYPCIQAIPHLSSIQKDYKNLVVLSMNSKDNNEKDKKHLPDFIKRNGLDYPLIMISEKTDSAYKVPGYPTLYIVDKTGKIVYANLGFGEPVADSLRAFLTTLKLETVNHPKIRN